MNNTMDLEMEMVMGKFLAFMVTAMLIQEEQLSITGERMYIKYW